VNHKKSKNNFATVRFFLISLVITLKNYINMKKITLSFLTMIACVGAAIAQPTVNLQAPQYDGSNSSLSIASGSTDAVYHRSCWLILQSELTGFALTNSIVTHFGLDYTQGVNAATSGQFTVSFQNTSDLTYNKGTAWPACLAGMSTHYTGTYSLPVTTGFTTVTLPLSTNFVYTGGGIYVACEWYSPTAAATQWARAQCNTTGLATTGGVRGIAPSAGPAPTTLSTTAFRPSYSFRATNTATNELGIVGFQPYGRVNKLDGLAEVISVRVRNNSAVTLTNVSVGLLVTGANPLVSTAVIASVGSGSTVSVNFPQTLNSTVNGLNSMSVSLSTDQNNTNNLATWQESVTCSDIGVTPAFSAGTFTGNSYGVNSASGGIFAFRYTTGTNPSTLSAVNLVVPSSTAALNSGQSYNAVLCDASGAILATGNSIIMNASNMDVFTPFTFSPPVALTPGTTYHFGVATSTNGIFPFGFVASANVTNGHYFIPTGGGAPVATDIDFTSLSATLYYPSTTLGLTASTTKTTSCKADKWVLTASGANTYTWNTNASTPTIVTSFTTAAPVVFYSVSGTNTLTGCKTNKAQLTFSVSACTGLESNGTYEGNVTLYPNPSLNGKVFVKGLDYSDKITVINVLGQEIMNFTANSDEVSINLQDQPTGNYMVKITNTNNQSKVIKLVNQN
jgi:hypothetical protein